MATRTTELCCPSTQYFWAIYWHLSITSKERVYSHRKRIKGCNPHFIANKQPKFFTTSVKQFTSNISIFTEKACCVILCHLFLLCCPQRTLWVCLCCAPLRLSCHIELIWLWKISSAPSTASTVLLPMAEGQSVALVRVLNGWFHLWRSTSAIRVTHKLQYQATETKLADVKGIIMTLPFRNVTPPPSFIILSCNFDLLKAGDSLSHVEELSLLKIMMREEEQNLSVVLNEMKPMP